MPSIERDGIRISYESRGNGPAILLGHSLLTDASIWADQVAALEARSQVVTVDLRGHGESGAISEPFSFDDVVADFVAVLDELSIDRAVWGGISIGGMIALHAARLVPERVGGLLLAGCDPDAEHLRGKMTLNVFRGVIRTFGMKAIAKAVTRDMFSATTAQQRPELVAQWQRRFSEFDAGSALNWVGCLVQRPSWLLDLKRLEIPVEVMTGTDDRSVPPEKSRALHQAIRGARLTEVPQCGHLLSLEGPEAVSEALARLL